MKKRSKKIKNTLYVKILSFIIPLLIAVLIVGLNSDYLIKKYMLYIVIALIVIFTGLFIYNLIGIFKNRVKIVNKKRKILNIIYFIVLSIYLAGEITMLVLLYGPSPKFRDWLITTAMQTMDHQYLCQIFYSDKDIKASKDNNFIVEVNEDTNEELITWQDKYDNEYDYQILERDEDAIYKLIEFEVNGQKAYLAAIYKPERVSVAVTKHLNVKGQYVTRMAQDNKAVLAINGGNFIDLNHNSSGGTPLGITISKGQVITSEVTTSTYGNICLTRNNVLMLSRGNTAEGLINKGARDCVTAGPFLIVNGKSSFTKGNGGWGYAARSAIGQREDGIILLLVVDTNATRSKGASMHDLTRIMENYGAVNASNLDGGTSSVMAINYEIINDPIDSTLAHRTRPVASSIIVK